MNKLTGMLKKFWKPLAGIAGLVIVVIYSSGSCRTKIEPVPQEGHAGAPVPAGAELFVVKTEALSPRVEVSGTVNSEDKVHVSPRIAAQVKEVLVSAGVEVKKGQVLFRLDDRDLQEQVKAAEAQASQARNEFSRASELLKNKATTEQAFQAAEAGFKAAQAQAERAQVMLGFAEIKSPLDGIVTDRRIEVGDQAAPGQVLLTVFDPKRMRLEAPVPVRLIDRLTPDKEVSVSLDRPARVLKGKVTHIVSEVEPMSRSQLVKVGLAGDVSGVLPGSFGRLIIEEAPRPGIAVPATAVYALGQLEIVQVAEAGRIVRRMVKTGAVRDDKVEILSGLKDGDRILVKPVKEG